MTRGRPRDVEGGLSAAVLTAASVSVVSLAVYCLTAARHLTLGDSAELVAVARTLGIAHPPGYPLYTLLAALAVRVPAGEPFFRLSILSALFAAVAAGLLSLLVWEVTAVTGSVPGGDDGGEPRSGVSRLAGSVVAGLAFALTPAVWSQATVPEVYTLSALLVFGVLFAFVRWRRLSDAGLIAHGTRGERLLWAGSFLLGLSLAHHLTAALVVPSAAVALSAGRGRHAPSRSVGRMLLFVLAGLSLYAYIPLRSSHDPGMLWAKVGALPELAAHVSGAQYASRLFAEPLPGVLAKLGSFFAGLPGELTWPVLSLACIGLAVLWVRFRRLFVVIVLELALVVAHAINYRIPDIGSYYIPAYAMLAVGAGVCVAELPRFVAAARARARPALALGIACAAIVPIVVHADTQWPARDLRGAVSGTVYLERLLDEVPRDAIVLAQNDRTVFPLWYARFVRGEREDVAIVNIRERAPHLEKWYSGVNLPTEEALARFSGRDPSVPCEPPARETLPVASYLPLLVSLNEGLRPIVADVDVGRDAFPERSVATGLLVEIAESSSGPQAPAGTGMALLEGYARDLAVSRTDELTRNAYATTLADLGQLLLVRGELHEGIHILETARDLVPEAAHVRNNLAVAYREAGRPADALDELLVALDLAPGRAGTYHNLSRLYLATGSFGDATQALAAAVRLEPRNVLYRFELASLLEKDGDFDGAEDLLRWVERNAGDDLSARLAYGDFLLRRERYTEAVAAYRRAEESRPFAAGVFTSLSRCYWEMEDVDAAVAAMRRSIELQPHNPRLKYDLALMLSRGGELREALLQLDDVARILPSAWQPIGLKASILGDMGLYDEARGLFAKARELGAEGEQFASAWSEMELAAGDTAAAMEILREEQ